jgi:hypothetical protein
MGWDRATVVCPHPSTLIRRVQFMPGWTASFDGTAEPVVEDRGGPAGLLQQVAVPAGRTTLRFTYLPPHEDLAVTAAALAALILVGTLLGASPRLRRRSTGRPRSPIDPGTPV